MHELGKRIKHNYEEPARHRLTRRMPVIIRVDGRAFHTYTKDFQRPFDHTFMDSMIVSATELMGDIQGAKLAYVQSDEVSIVLMDTDTLTTQAWFNYVQSKIESVAASRMTMAFNRCMAGVERDPSAMFDARSFNIPEDEVVNYFLWRALDWQRNSLQMYARSFFSHREMQGKGAAAIHDMLHEIDRPWTNLSLIAKSGTFLVRRPLGLIAKIRPIGLPKWDALNRLWNKCRSNLTSGEGVV